MSEVTTLPVADAMTARDLDAHQIEMERRLGKNSRVGLGAGGFIGKGPAHASLYPDGVSGATRPEYVHAATWSKLILETYAWIDAYKIISRDATIRKMALAIIELTDEHTKCTATMLGRKKFSNAAIAEFHEIACQRAGEMAGNAPFRVEFEA